MTGDNPTTSIYSIGVAEKKTKLTARRVRYYEKAGLVDPERTQGNQRLYSQEDIEKLKEIKSLLEQGLNLAGIKRKLKDK
ncbi:MerR family transcriptional regulator [Natroniella sulfidigena]|uniref:MerR family transcriptional regulator n=1 Tax=Natroniella sulfidigena TaxID=723921 RepID=UPI00200A9C40|nr:MerR family transcriptional regulator [Natroniella sulfidigena]MCK8817977.1 MerR family transcriptional regulator [Natroniella sulfidigena]